MVLFVFIFALAGCVTPEGPGVKKIESHKIERTAASYEEEGRRWGTKHMKEKRQPASLDADSASAKEVQISCSNKNASIDIDFVNAIVDRNYLDFFWVHSDIKDAFKKGYRLGYQERTADLVLGPHLTVAASCIGEATGKEFVRVVEVFESEWSVTLKNAINVFITLISEGSQADREAFIKEFINEYSAKYDKTMVLLKSGGLLTQKSEGGTLLYLDASKLMAVLNIPKPDSLKAEIYQQTFRVMGDKWGRRYSHNLIKRDELIDLLRRSKTALHEVSPSLQGNLGVIREAFRKSYGTDAENVFAVIEKEAGY